MNQLRSDAIAHEREPRLTVFAFPHLATGAAMLKWAFHQFSGYKKPFVWHVTGATPSGRPIYEFVHGAVSRRSHTGKFGDFEYAIAQPGLYKIGNTKDENGYRFVFLLSGIWRYRSVHEEAEAICIARELQAGEAIEELTQELIEKWDWHFPYGSQESATPNHSAITLISTPDCSRCIAVV